ncbi:MAG: hypothetical protein FWE85_04985 [Clostridiales bacterium]|nr:hypothetical protein [Clostridiales bacterium]
MKKYLPVLLLLCLICALAAGCASTREKDPDVNVDLTAMSSTLAKAKTDDILQNPSKYEGDVIKLYAFYFPVTSGGKTTQAISFDACCPHMEFLWKGEHAYPGDYPKAYTKIELTGVFESYVVDEKTYYRLVVDDIIIVK